MTIWNPWHGCRKISPGCANCYMYRRDATFGRDSSFVHKTKSFDLPILVNRRGRYVLEESDTVFTCMTSDFFIEEADPWRENVWSMIKMRSDLRFYIVTKRIERFRMSLPGNWGEGYDNVTICATCENQNMADARIPILLDMPIKHRHVIHEPMLGPINIQSYLATGKIGCVICGGESGPDSRLCDYDWILSTRRQCLASTTNFVFKQTGRLFKKDGCLYTIQRKIQTSQARKANINLKF